MSIWIPTAFDLSNAAPVDFRRITVLLVTGHDAALATDALRHIKVKAILFAWFRKALGDSEDGRQWLNFVQGLLGRLLPLLAQNKPDAIVFCPLNER
jgi:hypothetical protein